MRTSVRWFQGILFFAAALMGVSSAAAQGPSNTGPAKLLTASWLGGFGDDELVAVAIAPDMTIVLAGNTVDLSLPGVKTTVLGPAGTLQKDAADPNKKGQKWVHPSTHGFVIRLSIDGQKVLSCTRFGYGMATVRKLRLDDRGNIFILGNAGKELDLGVGAASAGTFVAGLTPDGSKVTQHIAHANVLDFGLDGNGEAVVLTKAKMTRYAADGKTQKWTVTWKAYGDNRPGAMTVSPDTGVAAVTGYGMTHTGKEPYKDPYGYGFGRDGKPLWSLWNPDPQREKDAKFSTPEFKTNGLMADTTGHAAAFGADGKIYFMLYADGGNTVCTRDPAEVDRPLDKNVFAGVFQQGPGYGFKGASKTSVVFRIDAQKGTLEKGTWLCAWINKSRANGLSMDAAASDARGRQFLVGNSAFGCPTKDPWYVCKEGGYQGGGYLAIMDANFQMLQCGYFPATTITSVSARNGYAVIAGHVRQYEDAETKLEARVHQPLQKTFGGGGRDGFFAVFKMGE
jgi:hypothetical protein